MRTLSTETQRGRGTEAKQFAETRSHGSDGIIAGSDTNPTVWALAALNMLFRSAGEAGGPESQIAHNTCFDPRRRSAVRRKFTRAFLNPPFSQGAEPERDFIDAAMDTLAPGGRCAAVVKAGIFADEEHAAWRAEFVRWHRVLGVISLPEDLFYPTAAPTSILLAEAGVPQRDDEPVLMARVWNDGFEKLKNKRVERAGCELADVSRAFQAMLSGGAVCYPFVTTVVGRDVKNGNEWSPQEIKEQILKKLSSLVPAQSLLDRLPSLIMPEHRHAVRCAKRESRLFSSTPTRLPS
jgi:hypothetical protein